MNLIEKFGGYENLKIALATLDSEKKDLLQCGSITLVRNEIVDLLLEYRRQHNIFEIGDLVTHPIFWGLFRVKEKMNHHVFNATKTGYESKLAIQLIRHATDVEIAVGRRL